MKKILNCSFTIPAILSLGALCISCASTNNSLNNVTSNDDVVAVGCSATVGHGFDFVGDPQAVVGQDYRCRFVSSTYELIPNMPFFPIHNELKPIDIEVVRDGQNIMSACELEHNVLIIPQSQIQQNKPITINILGGEIADWISWDEIGSISEQDIIDTEHEVVKQYFQVGDYKNVIKDNSVVSKARLIGFYADNYVYYDHDIIKSKPAPLTFEMQKSFEKREWGGGQMESTDFYVIPGWENPACPLYAESERKNTENDFGIPARSLDFNAENNYFSHFFPLSFHDYTGADLPETFDKSAGTISIGLAQGNNSKYSYYKPNEYITLQNFYDKISTRQTDDMFYIRDIDHTSAGEGTFWSINFRIQSDGKKCSFEAMHDDESYHIFWAFCL